jgi:predicted permease
MKLWNWWRDRPRRESELQEEIETHLHLAERDRVERGETTVEARAQVRREFGNVLLIKDVTRNQWNWAWLDHLGRDARYAMRAMWRTQAFSAVAVLSLALSIGASTALFSLVDALLLRSLPVKEPEHLVRIQRIATNDGGFSKPTGLDRLTFESVTELRAIFADVMAFADLDRPVMRVDGTPEPVRVVEQVTSNFFRGLGVEPAIGHAESAGAAVISYRFWKARFAGSSNALGRILTINDQSYPITGVAPPRFIGISLDAATDVWLMSPAAASLASSLIARLRPGVETTRAETATDALFQHMDQQPESTLPGRKWDLTIRAKITPAGKGLSNLRDQYRQPLLALMALVIIVLLITCINIGNLLVVRNAGRVRELTVRVALGARRSQLITQLLAEAAALAATGGAMACVVARWGVSAMLSMLPVTQIPEHLEFRLDARMLGFTLAVCLFTALLFALAPAWRATEVDLTIGLKTSPGMSVARGTRRLGRGLVAGQVALSVLLLAGAGLFIQTLRNLARADPGFDTRNLLQIELDTSGYKPGQVNAVFKLLLDRLATIPGVQSVTGIRNPVMTGAASIGFVTMGGRQLRVDTADVGPQFFETMRVPLLRGRVFSPEDVLGSNVAPVVVTESYMKQFFPGEDVLGKPMGPPKVNVGLDSIQIVGVIRDTKFAGLHREVWPMLFSLALREEQNRISALEVRTKGEPSSLSQALQREIRRVSPRLLISIKTMQDVIDRSIAQERMVAATSGFFGVLALVLSAIGVFGVASFTVARRTNEFGVRIALGAGRWDVIRESLHETVLVFGMGLIVGGALAFVGARLAASMISGLLFGLTATDWTNIAGTGLVLCAVAIAACTIPAIRATRIDPVEAIRYE